MSAAPGWYPQGAVQRYWDGERWTEHTAPVVAAPPVPAPAAAAPAPQIVVVHEKASRGKSVAKQRKDTSHTFHLLMTLITAGAWGLFVWLPMILWHRLGPRRKVVTRYR